jgi:hypothetical protein
VEVIVAILPLKAVIPRGAKDCVITLSGPDCIIAVARVDPVTAPAPIDEVVTSCAEDGVITAAAGQGITFFGSLHPEVFWQRVVKVVRLRKAAVGIVIQQVARREILPIVAGTIRFVIFFTGVARRQDCICRNTGGEDPEKTKKCKHA